MFFVDIARLPTAGRAENLLNRRAADLAPGTHIGRQQAYPIVLPQERLERVHDHGEDDLWGVDS